jgi:hypothetical protein
MLHTFSVLLYIIINKIHTLLGIKLKQLKYRRSGEIGQGLKHTLQLNKLIFKKKYISEC